MQHQKTSRNSHSCQKFGYTYLDICTELTPIFKQRVTYCGLQSYIKFTDVRIKQDLT